MQWPPLVVLSPKSEARLAASFASASSAPILPLANGELGVASWYGEECQGNLTASGEAFDMNGLTAAHWVYPLGTKIRVTNLNNNRSLTLRINDRGPGVAGRLLDVSKAAAQHLGFLTAGKTLVRIKVLSYPKGYLRARKLCAVLNPNQIGANWGGPGLGVGQEPGEPSIPSVPDRVE